MRKRNPSVAIIMGSDSDMTVMKEAANALTDFDVPFHMEIVSAHRTPDKMFSFAKSASDKGFKVLIAGAGGAAHLPGMVASLTTLPVIGVPVESKHLKGLDSLLSIAQMPKGVPVATMAINGAYNAGLLAIKILASSESNSAESSPIKTNKKNSQILKTKLKAFMVKQSNKVKLMNKSMTHPKRK